MFCWNCGNEIPDYAKFCPKCGKPISAEGGKQTSNQNFEKQSNNIWEGRQVNLNRMMVIAIASLALGILGVIVLIVTGRLIFVASSVRQMMGWGSIMTFLVNGRIIAGIVITSISGILADVFGSRSFNQNDEHNKTIRSLGIWGLIFGTISIIAGVIEMFILFLILM